MSQGCTILQSWWRHGGDTTLADTMAVLKLTKREVDRLEPRSAIYVVYDSELKGLGLRVMPSGTQTWIVEYRPNGGGRGVGKRRMSLGSARAVTPEQARQQARLIIGRVAAGEDPAHDRNTRRKEMKLKELIDLYEKERPSGHRSGKPLEPRTFKNMLARLRNHAEPLMGNRLVVEITSDDVSRFLRRVSQGETAKTAKGQPRGIIKVTGGEGAARKVASDLSMILSFAIDRGVIQVNPVSTARKPKAGKRYEYLRPEEMSRIGDALNSMEAAGVNPCGIAIIRLLLLTGARPSEIETLRWEEVDIHGSCLRLSSSKTGYSARPLSTEAKAIIEAQPRQSGSPYVFPSTRGIGYYTNSKKVWNKARQIANLPNRVRYHARHAVGTLSLALGQSAPAVAAVLGHANPRTTLSTYAHVVDELAHSAAQRIGRFVADALSGQSQAQPPASATTGVVIPELS